MSAWRPRLRWVATTVLSVLVTVAAIASTLAWFVHHEVLDTDRYVETVTPLAADPVLQADITDRITAAIESRVDVQDATAAALRALSDNFPRVPDAVVGLAPVIAEETRDYLHRAVADVVASDEFAGLWTTANRTAHRTLTAVLTGSTPLGTRVDDSGTVAVELRPVIERVRDELSQRGFSFATRLPDTDVSFVLLRSPGLVKAQQLVSALDFAVWILPLVTIGLGVAAVFAAPRGKRAQAVSIVGFALLVAATVIAVAVRVVRTHYLDDVVPQTLPLQTAALFIDAFIGRLQVLLRVVFAVAMVVLLAGFLTGSSRAAIAIRSRLRTLQSAVRQYTPSPIRRTVGRYRAPACAAVVIIAMATIVLRTAASVPSIIATALIAGVLVLAIALIGRPARPAEAPAEVGS